jgi:hypothetical protein
VPVPAIEPPPFGATEKALPAVVTVWSSASEKVTVTVVPFVPTTAEVTVAAVVSTTKERVALNEPAALEESVDFARQ